MLRKIALLIGMGMLVFSFSACQKERPTEGAGEKMEKAGETMEEAGKEMKEGTEEMGEKAGEMGEKNKY